MSNLSLVALTVFLVVTTTAAGAVAVNDATSANEAPLADAGLDQDVTKSATVLLDAAGSRDPDGRIERYDWSIRTPAGDTVTPDCADCARTRFTPTETGRYRVTITVTDDDGATSSDTLYVDVSPGEGPAISVTGATRPTEGSEVTYTATLSKGTAVLDRIVWRVDGTRIANYSLSADQTTHTVTKRFPTAGDRDVTATVYDADGLTNASSLAVEVQSQSDSPSESPGTTIADRNSPQIAGDTVVTGSKPLRGRYNARLDAPTSEIASVEWRSTAGRIGSGPSLTRTWEPGDHELYAVVTYIDHSTNVATFTDGTTTVIVDPRPNVSFKSLDPHGSISGAVSGVDEYENLNGLRVQVDGEIVAVAGGTARGGRRHEFGRQRTMRFSHADFTPGERHTVRVVATDKRGQTANESREIVPVEDPEIVRSEFVNGPVDSYHERLDPARYAAHHVLEIDLNGVDAGEVNVNLKAEDEFLRKINSNEYSWVQEENNDKLFVRSFWSGEKPKKYDLYVSANAVLKKQDQNWESQRIETFQVTPSKPELRLNVVNDGTEEYITREHGILVNASSSFDPDGTELKYIWKYGAAPTKPDNSTAKFRSYERAASIVEDEYDLRAKRNFDFLEYFVPEVSNTTVLSEGPYADKETVRVQVKTEPYHFSKRTYYRNFSLGISVSSPEANVVEWKTIEAAESGHSDATETPYRYVGVIEVPTETLASTSPSPTVTVYNKENARKEVEAELPGIGVSGTSSKYWTDATVQNLLYLVERPRTREVTVDTVQARSEYLDRGYEVDQTNEETKYVLERKVQTEDAKYETETQRFDSLRLREMFLASSNGWYASGRNERQRTKTETFSRWYPLSGNQFEKKWHDSSLWNGERTGKTREEQVESAEYRTQRRYSYENEIEKTKTMTIRRTGTRWVTKTGTRTIERCRLTFGCYEVTRTYTYRTKETYTYRTTRTYSYTVTKTETYWATSKRSSDHTFTGEAKRTKISDAVYETQFEVEYKTQSVETVTRYEVARDTKVRDAVYEWQTEVTTKDYTLARKQVYAKDDWRITTEQTNTWTLVRNDGTAKLWTPIYDERSDVVRTKAAVTGTLTTRSYDPKTGSVTEENDPMSDTFVYETAKSRGSIIEGITNIGGGTNWCKLKVACSQSTNN